MRIAALLLALSSVGVAPDPVTSAPQPAARVTPGIRVDLGSLPCPDRAHLSAELTRLLKRHVPPGAQLTVHLASAGPGRLSLRLDCNDRSLRKWLAFGRDDCAMLPQTVAFITRSWLGQSASVKRIKEALAEDPAPPPPPPVRLPVSTQAPVPEPQPAPALPVEAPPSISARLRVDARLAGFTSSLSSEPDSSRSGWRLGAGAEWLWAERTGWALRFFYDSPIGGAEGGGRVTASVFSASVQYRFTPLAGPRWALDFLAGPALHLIAAESIGYEVERDRLLAEPALEAEARVRWTLFHPVSLVAAAGAEVRAHATSMNIENLGAVLRLSAQRFVVSAGLAYEPF